MNVNAIRYGRIKRQAPDKIVVTKAQISDIIERMNECAIEPPPVNQSSLDLANKIWQSRHR